jgi:hypothetical protein
MFSAIFQLVACLPTVQAAGVRFPVRWFFLINMSIMILEAIKGHLFFSSAFVFSLPSFIHI